MTASGVLSSCAALEKNPRSASICDFSAPVRPIDDYAGQPDFPACAYGKHIDILGYTGVVVEIVKGSLKVQSQTGITRGYNGFVLRKLHNSPGKPV